jgi:hypothetical protein
VRTPVLILALLVAPLLAVPSFAQNDHARIAWDTPNPDYPLKVRILTVDRQHHYHDHIEDTHSYGSGNLLANPDVGFDYSTYCPGGFVHNVLSGEFYQGRWKQPDRKLEILLVQVGSKQVEKCTVNVTLKPAPYTHDNPRPHLVTAPH